MEKREKSSGGAVAANSPMGREENEDDNTTMRRVEPMVRLVPVILCVVALVLMIKNSETNDFGSLSYSDLGSFKYLVHANGICAGYALLSAIIAAMPRPSPLSQAWTFFFLDQILTYVILGAATVATEVLYLAQKGDTAITWSSECGSFGGFCHKATASVIITFVAVAFYAVLSLISSYKLFSKYDAPVGYPGKGGIEIAAFHG